MLNNNINFDNNIKLFQIIKEFQENRDLNGGIHSVLMDICKLFKFDKVSMVVEDNRFDNYITLFKYDLDGQVFDFLEENNIQMDFHASITDKVNDEKRNKFIDLFNGYDVLHAENVSKIEEVLINVGFENNEQNKELYISYIFEGNFFGYIVFEKYLEDHMTFEVSKGDLEVVFKVIGDYVGKCELNKQLYSTDLLTNSPSLFAFENFYDNVVRYNNKSYALCTLDIDKFKYINNIFGYNTGDEILKKVAAVIKGAVLSGETFCRVNEDKFAIIICYENMEELEGRLNELANYLEDMRKMYFSDKRIILVGGIRLIDKEKEMNLLMDQANFARKTIKGSHQNKFAFYDISVDEKIARDREIEEKMFDAVKNDEFKMYLQAKFNLNTRKICGAEALVRWITPTGMIFPDEFIPVFEKNGFISVLDFIIYEQVMVHIRESLDKGYKVYPISINVSRSHIQDPDFIFKIVDLITCYNIPKELLELEVTESVFVEDKDDLKLFIDRIKEQDLKVSIDDFGTAYSSLHILKDVNVDVIKIDKEFLHNINCTETIKKNTKDEIVIKHIINMAKELGFDIICEGIETDQQVELLKSIGCNLGQGYFFAKPINVEDYIEKFYIS